MKQVIRKGLRDIIVDEVPDPIVSPHHVIVSPRYSLISSGTETASIHQDGVLKEVAENPGHIRKVLDVMKVNGPTKTINEVVAKFSDYAVLGYSGAGVIVDKHPTVRDVAIGDRVAYGGEGTGHGERIMTGRNLVARVPEHVTFDHASFATLGSIAMNAVRIANLSLGDTVVVIGLGLVGQLTAQLARLQGGRVIAVDLKADRVELARELGADEAIAGGSARDAVLSITGGRGADCVIVAAAAKSSAPCELALGMCRDRGRIVVVGAVEMAFPWLEMYLKEIQLFMARAYGPGSYDASYEQRGHDYPLPYVRWTENRNMEEVLRLIGSGRLRVDELITHRFALEEAPDAYRTIMDPAGTSMAVVLRYPAADEVTGNGARTVTGDAPTVVGAARPTRPAVVPEAEAPGAPMLRKVALPASSTNAGKTRVALVGAGNIARWAHLPGIQALPDVALHAVYSGNGARGKSYANRYKAAYATTDYADVLNDPEIDAVLIVSRNQKHASEAVAALRAGKHVFVEKPMALTPEECRELVQVQAESGRQLGVGFNRRFAPYYQDVKRALSRRAGPAVLHCRVNSPGISGGYWMADPAIGGAILGEACHFVDLFYWLLGSEFEAVTSYSLPLNAGEPIGENNLVSSFRFADGSIANLTYCTVGSKAAGGERIEAFAPGVAVSTEDFKRLSVSTSGTKTRSKFFAEKGYNAQMAAFFESVRTGAPYGVDVTDGARATIACLQMLDSAKFGGERPIDWQRVTG